jgi:hypothetical protein
MWTATVNTPSGDALDELMGDAALVALLRGKPDGEVIPAAVWWLVAEALRTTVASRRALTLPLRPDDDAVAMLLLEAGLLTEAALAELLDAAGAQPLDPAPVVTPGTGPLFELQRCTLTLARLLVSHRPTSAQRLATALAAHAHALQRQLAVRQAS